MRLALTPLFLAFAMTTTSCPLAIGCDTDADCPGGVSCIQGACTTTSEGEGDGAGEVGEGDGDGEGEGEGEPTGPRLLSGRFSSLGARGGGQRALFDEAFELHPTLCGAGHCVTGGFIP